MKKYRQLEQISFGVCDNAQLFNAYRWDRLQPNCLPYAGGAVVVNTFRNAGIRLLAARLLRILTILHTDCETVLAAFEIGRDIKLKWDVTTAVVPDFVTVD